MPENTSTPTNPLRTFVQPEPAQSPFSPDASRVMESAQPGSSMIITQAIAAGIPWSTLFAYVVQFGLPKLTEWIQEWLAERQRTNPPSSPGTVPAR